MTSSKSSGQKLVSLTELLAQPLPFEDVVVPEYEVKIRLTAVTGLARAQLADEFAADETPADKLRFTHSLVAASIGGDATAESVGTLPAQVVDRLGRVALRLSGMGPDAADKAEASLGPAPNGASG